MRNKIKVRYTIYRAIKKMTNTNILEGISKNQIKDHLKISQSIRTARTIRNITIKKIMMKLTANFVLKI